MASPDGLMLYCLTTNELEHLLKYVLAVWIVSFVKYLVMSVARFLFLFFLPTFKNALYFLYTSLGADL